MWIREIILVGFLIYEFIKTGDEVKGGSIIMNGLIVKIGSGFGLKENINKIVRIITGIISIGDDRDIGFRVIEVWEIF